jgi:hypothetical protein
MSRFRCLAVKEQDEAGPDLRHRCDTLGGSSGSLIFDSRAVGIALHKEGGLDPRDPSSFNSATRMGSLIGASRILADLAARGPSDSPVAAAAPRGGPTAPAGAPARPAPAETGAMSTNQMNDVLRGR